MDENKIVLYVYALTIISIIFVKLITKIYYNINYYIIGIILF